MLTKSVSRLARFTKDGERHFYRTISPLAVSRSRKFVLGFSGKEGASWTRKTGNAGHFFETMSKRRRGFPSETKVKRGLRIVHGDKQLEEKVGRNDPCPCGSGKPFKKCCRNSGRF